MNNENINTEKTELKKVSVAKAEKPLRHKKARRKINFKVFTGKNSFQKGVFMALTNVDNGITLKENIDLIEGFKLEFSDKLNLNLSEKKITLPKPLEALKLSFSASDNAKSDAKKLKKVLKFLAKNLK